MIVHVVHSCRTFRVRLCCGVVWYWVFVCVQSVTHSQTLLNSAATGQLGYHEKRTLLVVLRLVWSPPSVVRRDLLRRVLPDDPKCLLLVNDL